MIDLRNIFLKSCRLRVRYCGKAVTCRQHLKCGLLGKFPVDDFTLVVRKRFDKLTKCSFK